MNLLIQEASMENVPSLTQLSNQLGYAISESAAGENLFAILKNNNGTVFIAVCEKEVIGWIHVFKTIRLESGPFCEIGGLIVQEQYQKKGVGKKLVEQVKLWSIGQGFHSLRVRCNLKRKDAHQFYLQSGFTINKDQRVFEIGL
jgi:GNAT superfamily N-acetyltransferase